MNELDKTIKLLGTRPASAGFTYEWTLETMPKTKVISFMLIKEVGINNIHDVTHVE
jgi:hypothetical protein